MLIPELIEKAFDYRGDVTLDLNTGKSVEGYIFTRDNKKQTLSLFPKGIPTPKNFIYSQIKDIRFTGEDTAAGKSWAEWKAKHGKK